MPSHLLTNYSRMLTLAASVLSSLTIPIPSHPRSQVFSVDTLDAVNWGSQEEAMLLPKGHLAKSGDILGLSQLRGEGC